MNQNKYIGSSPRCTQVCLSTSQEQFKTGRHKLRGTHTVKKFQQFNKFLRYFFKQPESEEVWSQVLIKIRGYFDKIENYLKELKDKTLYLFEEKKIETAFRTKDKNKIKMIQSIITQKYSGLKCQDIYEFEDIIDNFIPLSAEQAKKEAQQYCDQFTKSWRVFNNALQINIINENKKQQKYKNVDESKIFSVNLIADSARKPPSMKMSKPSSMDLGFIHSMQEKKQDKGGKKFLKIREIDQQGHNLQTFDTVLKVIDIKKKFKTGNNNRVQFTAGDHTGYATIVANLSSHIKQGNVIQLECCKIYMFKDRIKQIQPHTKKVIKPSRYQIQTINMKNNISSDYKSFNYNNSMRDHGYNNNEKRMQPRFKNNMKKNLGQSSDQDSKTESIHQRRGFGLEKNKTFDFNNSPFDEKKINPQLKKIEQIEPGDQQINILAEVYEIINIKNDKIYCTIGDPTGVVNAKLPQLKFIKEGITIQIRNINAEVQNQHIILLPNEQTFIKSSTVRFQKINCGNNISEKSYIIAQGQDQDNDDNDDSWG